MKKLYILLLACLISGCVTPLSLETDAPILVSELSINQENASHISYAYFATTKPTSATKSVFLQSGVFLLTEENIYLRANKPKELSLRDKKVIPIKSSKLHIATYGVRKQLQILYGSDVIVIDIAPNKQSISSSVTLEIGKKLKEQGIGEWKSEKFYGLDHVTIPIIL